MANDIGLPVDVDHLLSGVGRNQEWACHHLVAFMVFALAGN